MGGGGKSGKLFVAGDDGDPGPADAIMYFQIFNFKFLLPPPSPYSQAQDPDGVFRESRGGGGGGKPNFIPAVAGGVQGMSSFGITRRSSRS